MQNSIFGRFWPAIAIILAIMSLWPRILGWKNPAWDYLMYAALAVMLWLCVYNIVKLRRMKASDPSKDSK